MRKRTLWVVVPVGFLAAVVAAAVLLGFGRGSEPSSAAATYADGSSIEGLTVSRVADDAEELRVGSEAESSVDRLEVDGPLQHEALVRFKIPKAVPRAAYPRLRVAHREGGEDMWTLRPGRVEGNRFVYRTRQFSEMQLRLVAGGLAGRLKSMKGTIDEVAGLRAGDPGCADEAPGVKATVRSTSRDPLVAVCAHATEDGGLASLEIANKRAIGMTLSLPEGARVTRVTGRGLSETVWARINKAFGDQSVLLPGGGTATVLLREIPSELGVSADNSAMSTDALIFFATRGLGDGAVREAGDLAELVSCTHAAAGTFDIADASAVRLAAHFRELWASCGGVGRETGLGAAGALAFGSLKLGAQFVDSIRSIGGSTARVRVTYPGGGTIHAPSPGFARRYDLEWDLPQNATARGVLELGDLERLTDAMSAGYEPQCFDGNESRAAVVRGRFDIVNTTAGFDATIIPVLQPKIFEMQRGFFGGDPIGGRVTDDDYARIETGGGCPDQTATSSMFGSRDVPPDGSFGPIDFRVVYANVYGPEAPDGDRDRIDSLLLTLTPTPGQPLFGAPTGPILECVSGIGMGLGEVIPVTGGDTVAVGKRYGLKPDPDAQGCS